MPRRWPTRPASAVRARLTPDVDATERAELGERIATEASRRFARYWLAECVRIEEDVLDPGARWDILKKALAGIGAGPLER